MIIFTFLWFSKSLYVGLYLKKIQVDLLDNSFRDRGQRKLGISCSKELPLVTDCYHLFLYMVGFWFVFFFFYKQFDCVSLSYCCKFFCMDTRELMKESNISFRRGLAPHLKSLMGPWWYSQFDPIPEVSQSARRSLEVLNSYLINHYTDYELSFCDQVS